MSIAMRNSTVNAPMAIAMIELAPSFFLNLDAGICEIVGKEEGDGEGEIMEQGLSGGLHKSEFPSNEGDGNFRKAEGISP
ncbi:hypothetical protein M5689_002369 [Euphorbia peplus]|nr:hypothetical protein M5689_002369 [Euphorbia peplus]